MTAIAAALFVAMVWALMYIAHLKATIDDLRREIRELRDDNEHLVNKINSAEAVKRFVESRRETRVVSGE